jgi:hypothetical protein
VASISSRRQLAAILLTVGCNLLAAVSFGQTVPAEQAPALPTTEAQRYYPLLPGNIWTFDLRVGDVTRTIVNRASKPEQINGVEMVRIETVVDGNVIATEHLGSSAAGLFRYRFNGIELDPPLQLLKNPVKAGDTWTTEVKIGEQSLTIRCDIGAESVTVPAGKFDCVKLLVVTTVQGVAITSDYWLAADVGIVKQTMTINGQPMEMVLKEFRAGP